MKYNYLCNLITSAQMKVFNRFDVQIYEQDFEIGLGSAGFRKKTEN